MSPPGSEASMPSGDLAHGARLGVRYVVPGDPEWPTQVDDLMRSELLDHRGGPPLGLWVKGPTRLDELGRAVAIVGSRSATTYGTEVAAGIAATLVRAGHPVVSGAAFGIDQAAHRGALGVDGCRHRRARLRCRPRLPVRPPRPARPPRPDLRGDRRGLTRLRTDPRPLPQPQPTHRRPDLRHRRRRGGVSQRGPQHRQLGHPPQPPPDGRSRSGDQRPVPGRPRADPERCRHPGDPRRARARGRRRRRHPPRHAASRAGRAPATGCRRATRGCSTRCRSPARLPSTPSPRPPGWPCSTSSPRSAGSTATAWSSSPRRDGG